MTKPLFNRYFAYTDDGIAISDEAHAIIDPLFRKYREAGYSPREVAVIYFAVLGLAESGECIRHAMKLRKSERDSQDDKS